MIYDKNDLHEMFPLPSLNIPTRGNATGIILKFRTFYLKIYDDVNDESYIVQGYRYNESLPVFNNVIPAFQIREFASRFTREDYLIGFQEPCDDPHCFLLGNNMMRTYN